ncbi:hypothetical protein EV127DRAFT_52551 [Xylaria flabelliformis]|nr:hypothetical protein EV127DRAFT_52551 [Xylaria flabelliformis]
MLTLRDYFFIACVITAFNAPMTMISELFTFLLIASAPLIARATCDGAPSVIIAALEDFVCLVVILILVAFVRTLDQYLSLSALPGKFFEILGSL